METGETGTAEGPPGTSQENAKEGPQLGMRYRGGETEDREQGAWETNGKATASDTRCKEVQTGEIGGEAVRSDRPTRESTKQIEERHEAAK